MAAGRWMGRGDKNAVDGAAVNALRYMLNTVPMSGVVVIGEGEKDEAPMLFNGEHLGAEPEPEVDIAVDPIDGTRLTALGLSGAISVVALSDRGSMFNPKNIFYMNKLVVGPEGVGKTSVVMAQHHEIAADLERRGESTLAMYAFADYKTVEEKRLAFNKLQQANGLVGVVIPSFAKMYEEECQRLGFKMISTIEAARSGYSSRFSAIRESQPQVMARFRQRHAPVFRTLRRPGRHLR